MIAVIETFFDSEKSWNGLEEALGVDLVVHDYDSFGKGVGRLIFFPQCQSDIDPDISLRVCWRNFYEFPTGK